MNPAGLPHSAIQGSLRVCHSPWLIAAYHGLPRLRVPRHPPHAFTRLTTTICAQAERLRSFSSDLCPTDPTDPAGRTGPTLSSDNHENVMLHVLANAPPTKLIVLNKDSQIRDLPLLPLSKSVDAHRPGANPRTRRLSKKIECGLGCVETSDYRRPFSHPPQHGRDLLVFR